MILAIDTASSTASAAITDGNRIISEFSVLSEKTHSKAVLPMIEGLFKCAGKTLEDIDYIACSLGPGSFTGLRIGAAVAKSIAFTLNKKIIPVASLDTLAYNVLVDGHTVCPVIDARRKHVYTAFYKYEGTKLCRLTDYMTVPLKDAVSIGRRFNQPYYFIGSGAEIYYDELKDINGAVIAPSHINIHRAGIMGVYAYEYIDELTPVDGSDFEPVYMSRSQAEADNEQR